MSEETSCLRIISYLTLKNSHIIMLKSEKQSFYPTLKLWRKWNLESHFYGKKSSLAFQSGGLILAESPFKESLLFSLDAFFPGLKRLCCVLLRNKYYKEKREKGKLCLQRSRAALALIRRVIKTKASKWVGGTQITMWFCTVILTLLYFIPFNLYTYVSIPAIECYRFLTFLPFSLYCRLNELNFL